MAIATKNQERLSAQDRRELPNAAFGIPETREFPLIDAEHVRSAESYFRYAPNNAKPALARRILRKAKQFGIEVRSESIHNWAKQQ